jgi:hypothetical protein
MQTCIVVLDIQLNEFGAAAAGTLCCSSSSMHTHAVPFKNRTTGAE